MGKRLRYRRMLGGLTLKGLALKVGCSESLLSKIENDKATPSLTTLHKIASALGTSISELFSANDAREEVVLRSGMRPVIFATSGGRSDGDGIQLERLLPPAEGRLLQADIYIIPPGYDSEGRIQHEGEEMGYVLEGNLELIVDNETFTLNPGDSFVFRSELFHGFANKGDVVARIIWVNTPPTF